MTTAVYISIYAGVFIFLVGAIVRVVRYSRKPMHLRWELYPLPHEESARAAHGGSYFETLDWWKRPQRFNRVGELGAMAAEIGLLKALWEFNRGLWYSSFLFHAGLYATFASVVIAIARVLALSAGATTNVLVALMRVQHAVAWLAIAMTLIGAVGLLFRRFTDPELTNYTSVADLFNLNFFIVVYGVLAAGYLVRPPDAANLPALLRGLLSFDTGVVVGRGFGVGIVMGAVLLAYIPFTHMAHFIAKYFTYHEVRWDDRVNARGGSMEPQIAKYLAYKPTWAAAHLGADGRKTWAEIATTNPTVEVRK